MMVVDNLADFCGLNSLNDLTPAPLTADRFGGLTWRYDQKR